MFRFNEVYDNGTPGVIGKGLVAVSAGSQPSSKGGLVSYNKCYGNVRQGLQVGGSNGKEPSGENICEYNQVYGNGNGIRVEEGRYQILRYNNVYGNTQPDIQALGTALAVTGNRDCKIYKNFFQDSIAGVGVVSYMFDADSPQPLNFDIYSNYIRRTNAGPLMDLTRQGNPAGVGGINVFSNIFVHPGSAVETR